MPRTRKPTIAMLNAKIAALEGLVESLNTELTKIKRANAELRDIAAVHKRVPQLSHEALIAQCEVLAHHGIPTRIHHGHILHGITGAIIQ